MEVLEQVETMISTVLLKLVDSSLLTVALHVIRYVELHCCTHLLPIGREEVGREEGKEGDNHVHWYAILLMCVSIKY